MVENNQCGKRNKQPGKNFEKQKVVGEAALRVEVQADVRLPQLHPDGTSNFVKQLDENKIVMYRRHEDRNTSWKQIVIDREPGTVESSCVGPNPNGTMFTVENSTCSPVDDTLNQCGGKDQTRIAGLAREIQGLEKEHLEIRVKTNEKIV